MVLDRSGGRQNGVDGAAQVDVLATFTPEVSRIRTICPGSLASEPCTPANSGRDGGATAGRIRD
jgi:hypothetical protein